MFLGQSSGGRAINVHQLGRGSHTIMLVGGIHGGWEANTIALMEEFIDYFANRPEAILPDIRFFIVPVMNPDGLAMGNEEGSRFNSKGVDLNRNWGCGWSQDAVWRSGPVDPGTGPMSEPETQIIADFIESTQPEVVLFYHSAANGIFAGDCSRRLDDEWRSGKMAAVYGEAANYSYGSPFTAYPVTGTAPSWVDGLGIPSADVELSSSTVTQFERNLRGIQAVQCWVVQTEQNCPLLRD